MKTFKIILVLILSFSLFSCTKKEEEPVDMKPVLYLYPQEETEITVKLDYDGELTVSYPLYKDGWKVTASPEGTLSYNGQTYNYLYWEGTSDTEYDFSRGFCIKKEDTASFLEDSLSQLGLNRREANEFIIFWLPILMENEYSLISFQSDAYTSHSRLDISPKPDTLIRVFMACRPLNEPVEIESQELSSPIRKGFTAVEWGGTIIK